MCASISDHHSYFDNLERITQPNYMPSTEDILRSRKRTNGVIKSRLEHGLPRLNVYDFGRSRSLQYLWEPNFGHTNIMIFVTPIDAYDRCLVEDVDSASAT